jgi:hypothetical protein
MKVVRYSETSMKYKLLQAIRHIPEDITVQLDKYLLPREHCGHIAVSPC